MTSPIRTALFVDFDNVFGSLFSIRPSAAHAFGRSPDDWLRFFETGQHAQPPGSDAPPVPRSILMRRCYLNPEGFIDPARADRPTDIHEPAERSAGAPVHFRGFRGFFTRAGFSVVDCPRLTRGTKNSADIVMAMDIMDALAHPTRFEEFIILSADADFTPVLVRLREHDRRTSVYANRLAAAPYRAASDFLIGEHDFIERALGISGTEAEKPRTGWNHIASAVPIAPVAKAVADHIAEHGRMWINDLTSILHQYPEFRDQTAGRWLGFGTMTRLFEEIVRLEPSLAIDKSDPQRWMIGVAEDPATLTEQVIDAVRELLALSPRPILLSHLGNLVRRKVVGLPPREWPNGQSFSALLTGADDPHIALIAQGTGFAYDPTRHDKDDLALPRQTSDDVPPPEARADERSDGAIHADLVAAIHGIVEDEPTPLALDDLVARLGGEPITLPSGVASLATFIGGLDDRHLALLRIGRGFVYDPTRHDPFVATATDDDGRMKPSPALQSLVEMVFAVTECPRLLPNRYGAVFDGIAQALATSQFDLTGEYGLQELTWAVEDNCEASGFRLSRDTIQYVITTLDDHVEWPTSTVPDTYAQHLAEVYADSLEAHCADNRVELSEDERSMLRLWIGSESNQDEVVAVDHFVASAPAEDGLDLAGPMSGDAFGVAAGVSGEAPSEDHAVGPRDHDGVATVETALHGAHAGREQGSTGA